MHRYPYNFTTYKDILEVVDTNDTPFMLMPLQEVLTKQLGHRKVYAVLCDGFGHVLLWHSEQSKATQYNLVHTLVHAGEARETSLMRILHDILNFPMDEIEALLHMEQESLTIWQHAHGKPQVHSTFFFVFLEYAQKSRIDQRHLWLDFDELQGLKNHFPELLSQDLLQLMEQGHFAAIEKIYTTMR